MKTALTVIFIIASILLIILVLMQEGKEAGLGSLTGAADSGTYWSKNKGRSNGRNTDQSDNILYDCIFRNSSNPLLKIYLEKR